MEKRVIVFLIVSLAVIIGYDFLLKGMGLVPPPETTQEVASTDRATSVNQPISTQELPGNSGKQPSGSTKDVPASVTVPPRSDKGSASEEQTIEVNTDLFRAKFSNRAALPWSMG